MKGTEIKEIPLLAITSSVVLSILACVVGIILVRRAKDPVRVFQMVFGFCGFAVFALLLISEVLRSRYGSLIMVIVPGLGLPPILLLAAGAMLMVWTRSGKPVLGKVVVILVGVVSLLSILNARSKIDIVLQLAKSISPENSPVKDADTDRRSCPANLKALWTAFNLYAQDWDALPLAPNWCKNSDLVSRVPHNYELHCPAVSNGHDTVYGYAYNDKLSGLSLGTKTGLNQLPNASTTPLLYDSSNLTESAHDAFTSLPVPGRHSGKDYVVYMDGHVAAVTPSGMVKK